MYAFLGHGSAIDALRFISSKGDAPKALGSWPLEARRLPSAEHCITAQKEFKRFAVTCDLSEYGVESVPVHLLVPSRSAASKGASARFHVWSREVPALSMLRLDDELFASGPELAILQLCAAQSKLESLLDPSAEAYHAALDVYRDLGIEEKPLIDNPLLWEHGLRLVRAAAVACEFAGTYRLPTHAKGKVAYKRKLLMTCESLDKLASELRHTSAETRAQRVAAIAFDGSASPMETLLALLLTLPVEMGGFGLPRPELNHSIDVSHGRGLLADRDEVTPDMLWDEAGLALEYDSAEKHGNAGPARLADDALRSNMLTVLGYRVLRVTPGAISTVGRLEMLANQIAVLLGTELEKPSEMQKMRRRKLFTELMPAREQG